MGLNYGCKQKLKIKNKLKYSNKEQYEKSLSKNILIELIFYIKNLIETLWYCASPKLPLHKPNWNIIPKLRKFPHCGDNHYNTRSAAKKLLNTKTYITQSAKYKCAIDWNNFQNLLLKISLEERTYMTVKLFLKRYYLEKILLGYYLEQIFSEEYSNLSIQILALSYLNTQFAKYRQIDKLVLISYITLNFLLDNNC